MLYFQNVTTVKKGNVEKTAVTEIAVLSQLDICQVSASKHHSFNLPALSGTLYVQRA